MVANDMLDSKTNEIFTLEKTNETKWWSQATPIWIENEQQGHESGVCFWPGYNVIFNGTKAKYIPSQKYDAPYTEKNVMPINKRLALVFDWLRKDNVTFVALYIEHPDSPLHSIGPDRKNKEFRDAIRTVDKLVGRLRSMMKTKKLFSSLNIIILGDHGHIKLSYQKQVHLGEFVNLSKYATHITGTTSVMIHARPGYKKLIYNKLKNAEDHFKVYLKEEIPKKYHIKQNNRTADILVIGEPGWAIFGDVGRKEWYRASNKQWKIGDHGYSNFAKSMNPAFFAFGPAFRSNFRKQSVFAYVSYYPLEIKKK